MNHRAWNCCGHWLSLGRAPERLRFLSAGRRILMRVRRKERGTKSYSKRELGTLLRRVRKDDLIICAELSRLGRNLFMIMEILNICMAKECKVWTIKDNYRLGEDIQSKVLAFAFGLSAEIERNLISQRTKEALARKRAEGVVLGRPKGRKTALEKRKLYGKRTLIAELMAVGMSQRKIAKICKVDRNTLWRFLKSCEEE